MTERDPRLAMAKKLEADVFARSSNKEEYLRVLREHVMKLKTYARSQAAPRGDNPAAVGVPGRGAVGHAGTRPGGSGAQHVVTPGAPATVVAHQGHIPAHDQTASQMYRHPGGGQLDRAYSGDFAQAMEPARGAVPPGHQAYPGPHYFAEGMRQGMQDGQGFNAQYIESAFLGNPAPPAGQGTSGRTAVEQRGPPAGVPTEAGAATMFGGNLPPLPTNPEGALLGEQDGDQELFDFLLGPETAETRSLQAEPARAVPQAAAHYQQQQQQQHQAAQAQHQLHQHQHHHQFAPTLAGAQAAHAHYQHQQAQAAYFGVGGYQARGPAAQGDAMARGRGLWEGHDAGGRPAQQVGTYGIPSPSGYPGGFHARPTNGPYGGDAFATAQMMQRQHSEVGQSPHTAHAMRGGEHLGAADPFAFMGAADVPQPPPTARAQKLPAGLQKEFEQAQRDAQQRLTPRVVKALKLVKHLMKVAQAAIPEGDLATLWLKKQAIAGQETMRQHWRQYISDFSLLVSPRKKVQEGVPMTKEFAREYCAGVAEISSRIGESNRFIEQVEALFRAFAHRKAVLTNEQGLSMSGGSPDAPGNNYPPGSGGFLVGEEVPLGATSAPALPGAEGSAAPGGGKKRAGGKTLGPQGAAGGKKAKKAAAGDKAGSAKSPKGVAAKKGPTAASKKKAPQDGKKTVAATKKAVSAAKKAPAKKPPVKKVGKQPAGGPKASQAAGPPSAPAVAATPAVLGPGEQLMRSVSHASPGAKARVGSALRDMLHKPDSGPAKLAQLFFLSRPEAPPAPGGGLQRQGSLNTQSKVASPCTPASEASADTTEAALPKSKASARSAEDLLQAVYKALGELPGREGLDVAILGQKEGGNSRAVPPASGAEAPSGPAASAGGPAAAPAPAVVPPEGILAEVCWKDRSCAPLMLHFGTDFPRTPPSAVFRHAHGEGAALHDGALASFASRLRLLPPAPGLSILLQEWHQLATHTSGLAPATAAPATAAGAGGPPVQPGLAARAAPEAPAPPATAG